MSATLLDKDVFRASVGLEGAPYLSIPTPFKASAFGLSFRPVGKMTRDHIDRTLRDYPRAIRRILDENPDAKGIIHTTNYKITRALREALADEPRLLFQQGAGDRENMLLQHTRSKAATVLVSPSMMEGLDLRDDLGRFQIMCKVPYPDLSDPIVKAKDRDWYSWRTVRTLVQAVGRSVRSADDWTRTYILDSSFMDLLERSFSMFPDHLKTNVTVENPF
jgi:Rad3-related DNA helicase